MADKHADAARYAFIQTTLVLGILGLVAVVAVVGMLLGNDKCLPVLTTVIGPLGYALGVRKARNY
jgi:hypothetical protein